RVNGNLDITRGTRRRGVGAVVGGAVRGSIHGRQRAQVGRVGLGRGRDGRVGGFRLVGGVAGPERAVFGTGVDGGIRVESPAKIDGGQHQEGKERQYQGQFGGGRRVA